MLRQKMTRRYYLDEMYVVKNIGTKSTHTVGVAYAEGESFDGLKVVYVALNGRTRDGAILTTRWRNGMTTRAEGCIYDICEDIRILSQEYFNEKAAVKPKQKKKKSNPNPTWRKCVDCGCGINPDPLIDGGWLRCMDCIALRRRNCENDDSWMSGGEQDWPGMAKAGYTGPTNIY